MSIELNKIKAKITALAAKTVAAGCSEHEAELAMETVGRLLLQYNLTMDECDVRQSRCKTLVINTNRRRQGPIMYSMVALANLAGAKIWKTTDLGLVKYCFFGQEQDLELVEYLYKVIDSAIEAETDAFKSTDIYVASPNRKSATTSFGHGMADRISYRLDELRKHNERDLAASRTFEREEMIVPDGEVPRTVSLRGTALIVLKKQLVEEEFAKTKIKLQRGGSRTRTRSHYTAYDSGKAAGDKVNLSRPIEGSTTRGYLK